MQKGDTLYDIAHQYQVDYTALLDANTHLSDPHMIVPGMKITIPTTSKQVRRESEPLQKQQKAKPNQRPITKLNEDENEQRNHFLPLYPTNNKQARVSEKAQRETDKQPAKSERAPDVKKITQPKMPKESEHTETNIRPTIPPYVKEHTDKNRSRPLQLEMEKEDQREMYEPYSYHVHQKQIPHCRCCHQPIYEAIPHNVHHKQQGNHFHQTNPILRHPYGGERIPSQQQHKYYK